MNQGDAIAVFGLVEIRQWKRESSPIAEQLVEDPPEIAARNGIDPIGRRVEEQHLGRVYQAVGQAELCPHSADRLPASVSETAPDRRGQQPIDSSAAALGRGSLYTSA